MEQKISIVPGNEQGSLNGGGSVVSDIEQASLELRLAEEEIFRGAVTDIKMRHKKKIFQVLLIAFGIALITGALYCQLIHCPLVRGI
ncbi:MAG: hypothetical protein ABIJ85_03675 [bacterium]